MKTFLVIAVVLLSGDVQLYQIEQPSLEACEVANAAARDKTQAAFANPESLPQSIVEISGGCFAENELPPDWPVNVSVVVNELPVFAK